MARIRLDYVDRPKVADRFVPFKLQEGGEREAVGLESDPEPGSGIGTGHAQGGKARGVGEIGAGTGIRNQEPEPVPENDETLTDIPAAAAEAEKPESADWLAACWRSWIQETMDGTTDSAMPDTSGAPGSGREETPDWMAW